MRVGHVVCSEKSCSERAQYKIAAFWSDGHFQELKTYGFACSKHLRVVFKDAQERRDGCSPTPGETLEELDIYQYEIGKRDRQLKRLWGLEHNCRSFADTVATGSDRVTS